ncbi:MAG: GAF domain-containing sensor histidine kinase [Anaerolineae bacterium]
MDNRTDGSSLEQRNRELLTLKTFAEALNREVDLPETLHAALKHVTDLFHLETGWIWLVDETTHTPYLAATQNLPPALQAPGVMDGTAYCYCLEIYESGGLDAAANVSMIICSRLKGLLEGTKDLKYHSSVPLYAHGKNLGVLNVASVNWRKLTPDELRVLYTVGDMLSIAIERARLFRQSSEIGALEERNRLAREIHDTLAQSLAALTLKLETIDALMETSADAPQTQAQVRELVKQTLKLTRASMDDSRRSVLDLRAAPLEGQSFVNALRGLAEATAARNHLTLTFNVVDMHPLPQRIEVGLYRIAQEALNNVEKHAHATTLHVDIKALPDQVLLSVIDNGQGFAPSHTSEHGYGLIGLNERIRLLKGELRLCTNPGEGTRLNVCVPLNDGSGSTPEETAHE